MRILKRFNMAETSPQFTPAVPNRAKPSVKGRSSDTGTADNKPLRKEAPYRETVGCLMYLMTATRLDLVFSVARVSRNLDHPTEADWTAVKRIYRYIQGTASYGI